MEHEKCWKIMLHCNAQIEPTLIHVLGTLPHFGLAIVYIFLHAMLMLFQATTLNVAFNSHNKALLTIMMSNNFVELKGSVFKKFEKNNLFQVRILYENSINLASRYIARMTLRLIMYSNL